MEDEYIEALRNYLKLNKYTKKQITPAYDLIRKCVPLWYFKKDFNGRAALLNDLEKILDEMLDY